MYKSVKELVDSFGDTTKRIINVDTTNNNTFEDLILIASAAGLLSGTGYALGNNNSDKSTEEELLRTALAYQQQYPIPVSMEY